MKNQIMKVFNNVKTTTVKHSPELLLALGIASGIGAIAMAVTATRKVDDILAESNEAVEKINAVHNGELETTEEYTEQDYKKDLTITYVKTGLKVAKLYAPAALLEATSIGCCVGSHTIMSKRNAGLTATCAALSTGFSQYRKRVTDELGEEMDRHFRYGTKAETVTVLEPDPENSNKNKKTKKQIEVVNKDNVSKDDFSFFFDEGCREWSPSMTYNLTYARSIQNQLNDQLIVKGRVYLNDVYEAFGYNPGKQKMAMARMVGWIYDPESEGEHHNYIDLGLKNADNIKTLGYPDENVLLIDPNIDPGIIWNK